MLNSWVEDGITVKQEEFIRVMNRTLGWDIVIPGFRNEASVLIQRMQVEFKRRQAKRRGFKRVWGPAVDDAWDAAHGTGVHDDGWDSSDQPLDDLECF